MTPSPVLRSKPDTLLDYQLTALIVVSETLHVRYLNAAAESILGVSSQASLNQPLLGIFNDEQVHLTRMQSVLDTGESFTRRGAELVRRDGSSLLADYTVLPLPDAQELLIEMQPMNRLVRINRDDQSVNSQETTRKLVRGLAHEVKNPLGGIRGAAQLLARELVDPALREYTQVIIEETDRLTSLVDRMLGPSRAPNFTDLNIHRAMERVIALIEAEFPGQVQFRRDYDPSLPGVPADEDQIVQALLNIMRNAVQALERHPAPSIMVRTRVVRQFTIGTTRHRLVAQIDIEDNGPGIPEELFDRMFYPMISGRQDGTGLGLAITQSIIGQHGGVLECNSQPGKTCFSVFLPLERNAS